MRKLFLVLAVLFFSDYVISQEKEFNLSDYKLPDIKRHQLDFNFKLSGRNEFDDYFGYDQKLNSFTGRMDADYNFYRNTRNLQSDQKIGFYINSNFSDSDNGNNGLTNNKGFYTGLYIDSKNRFYKNDRNFYEVGLFASGYYDQSEGESFNDTYELNDRNLNISMPLYSGFGRIEQIQDARLALYIIEDLKKNGKLKKEPSKEEIIELAQYISKLKNERFFDSRIKKIEDLEKLYTYLESEDILESADISSFTIINDDWDHASNRIRESGTRFAVGIEPFFGNQRYLNNRQGLSYDYENEYKRNEYGLMLNIRLDYEKPINLYWQSSLNFKLSGGFLMGKYEALNYDNDEELEAPIIESNLSYAIGYYPNTRTDIELSVGANFIQYLGNEKIDGLKSEVREFNIIPRSSLNVNYYISTQVRLNGSYSYYLNYRESNSDYLNYTYATTKYYRHYLSLGIVYQIF